MTNNAITYAENYTLIDKPITTPWRPGQSQAGYGRKIATDHMLIFDGNKRKYRVYCCIYSNIGSCYVLVKGQWLFVRD